MGSAASTAGGGGAAAALNSASLEDQDGITVDALCEWITAQHAGAVGETIAARCRDSGLSAPELLLLMDQETLLPTLGLATLSGDERKYALALILAGRNALRKEFQVSLKELPDAMDKAVYVLERFPLVLDPSGQATRFLKYQRSAVLMVGNPRDMEPASLRRHLVGALRHGTWLVLDFDTLSTLELEQFFMPGAFPQEVLSRQALFRPDVIASLLRPGEGDPDPVEFVVNDQFKLIVLCRSEQPPPKTALGMCVLRVHIPSTDSASASSNGANGADDGDQLARALGVSKEVKRNSLEMVEAAFDNDLEIVTKCLDQNYDIESADGHGHTATSEAACQGNLELLRMLLERGADPNKMSDEKRSALYRAAYNGHVETVKLLLESGADPRIVSKQSETAFDVAKSDDVRDVLQQWDISQTERLLEQRRQLIELKWQERIVNHVERERFALMKVHEELLDMVRESDDADALEARFEQLVNEAIESGEKPRASTDVRDAKGSTLLAIAAQLDHAGMVAMLLTRWKIWKELAQQSALSHAAAAKDLARKQELMAKTLKANVNARDCRGWTPVAIAVFHESKKSLRLLLEHGADPKLKNQYNKNAYDFAKDDMDAALQVVRSRAEIRQVLTDWENERRAVMSGDATDADSPAVATEAGAGQVSKDPSVRGGAAKKKKKAAGTGPAAAIARNGKDSSTSIVASSTSPAKKPVPKAKPSGK